MTRDLEALPAAPPIGLLRLTHAMYAMHAFSAVTGMLTPMFVVTAFLTGWPSLLAVLLNYLKRAGVRGTVLESHFSWQLRTFWWAVCWLAIAAVVAMIAVVVLSMTIVGLLAVPMLGYPLAVVLLMALGFWVLYRLLRGWLALLELKPLPRG